MIQFIKKYKNFAIVILIILVSAAVLLFLRNIGGPGQFIPAIKGTPVGPDGVALQDGGAGLSIVLSDGKSQPQDLVPLPVVEGLPLSSEEIEQILLRLPPLKTDPQDSLDFRLPEEVLAPPRTGETIEHPFPPEPESIVPDVEGGPLAVLRFSPEGDIPIAAFVNVTFNQPMVPLATLEDLANSESPVQIEPSIPGTWRWLGTKTINFQYDSDLIDRMPMATAYTVTIPAGTNSAIGAELSETVQFTFSTPPPTYQNTYPYSSEPQPLDPLFFISFDQRIDQTAVLETITVEVEGTPVSIKLASMEEIEADESVARLVESANEGRWLAFKAINLLPKDSSISVNIGPGTPSAEGPLVTEFSQTYSFHTYAPLKIVDHGCSWWDEKCPPLTPLYIEFNNPINTESYDERMLRIAPEIPGATLNLLGDTITIRGATQGRTTYRATVNAKIEDIFGQKLGRDRTVTFKVGPAEPFLTGPDSIFVTLDPAAQKPVLSLYAMNYNRLDVKVYRVTPSDWNDFKLYLQEYQYTDRPSKPPGKLGRDETLRLDVPPDKLTEIGIDLTKDMDGVFGHFIVIAKPPRGLFEEERYWEHVQVWVQVTQIGLDAFVDHSQMVVWATDLNDGSPLQELTIETDSGIRQATTGPNGIARFSIPSGGATYLVARQGDDQAMLPASTSFWDEGGWHRRGTEDELRWYVLDDRQMYRPGEEVHVKGWLRQLGRSQDGDVGLIDSGLTSLSYQVFEPQGNEIGMGRVDVNALGGFDFHFDLPENTNLGYARIEMNAEIGITGRFYTHSFQIQEFRRPEFEVVARNETKGPYFVGDSATVAVEANYFAGGALPNAEVNWLVSSTPTNYNPPNWPDFSFGIWQPWWWFHYDPGVNETIYQNFSGLTDTTGNHFLMMDFGNTNVQRPFSVFAESTVTDVNRQAWVGLTNLLVHPADLYVGMRSERYFVERGESLDIELILTDLDGNLVADREINVSAARLEWKFEDGGWNEKEVDIQECNLKSDLEPVVCTFDTPIGGRYQITAIIRDELGRRNKTQIIRWVSGGDLPPARKIEQEQVTLIPNQETYQPGDVAEILVQSPFVPAEGLLTVSRNGIIFTDRFVIDDGSITLSIPIEEKYIPNLHIQVDLVGSVGRTDDQGEVISGVPARPAYASGSLNLSIPPLQRTLALTVTPVETELEPGENTTINVELKDANGEPVANAELAVIVVDEAILALTGYELLDPIAVFYTARPSDVWSIYSRASIILADPLAFESAAQAQATQSVGFAEDELDGAFRVEEAIAEGAIAAAPVAAEAKAADLNNLDPGLTAITVRTDFNPLATFAPEVRTDKNGQARIRVNLPDNLTRYRIMVVAVDERGNKFGSAESNLTARLPLMVRPSAPRFLNFGDNFEFPVVLQNQTDTPLSVDVAMQTSNITLTDHAGFRVIVPANDRIEVRFPAATDRAGTARFQIAAVSGDFNDAASGELPVYTPATTEAFATYGVIDQGAIVQPILAPEDVFPQFGGLEIQTSSTALQALTDAVIYLVSYPYQSSEQIASRILGVAALRDVLSAFKAEGLPSASEMEAALERDMERLGAMQNFDGGFPYWRRGQDSIPFITIHVAHAFQRAELKGFDVPQNIQEQTLYYLQDIESHYPHWYSQSTRWTLSAYALFVRDLMDDNDPAKARQLLDEASLEHLSLDAIGWIWQVLVDDPNSGPELEAIRRYIANRVVETAGAANFTISYDDQTYLLLSSNRRTDAILLDAMIADDPDNDLIPKLVTGLLAHRIRGHWGNTQENVFVLLSLDRYFNTFEAQTPDFVARIWLGDTYVGGHEYVGRSTERHETKVPMAYLVNPELGGGGTQNLIINKTGPGRLYYRLGLKYAPTDLWLEPLDMGFVVLREYEAVDDPEEVYLDNDGTWHIKAGARVRVRLTMVADNRRYHVALVDPLPAGLEIVNPALAVSQSIPQDPNSSDYRSGWWWWGTWYEHQNMRDERAEAFTTLLWDGVYEYTYIARATTPGTFIAPPAKAEEMYSPEVFGRSSSDWVIVE
ncbi:MAG: alpha-2-macroglobulin family protein [Anaerolineae bacterium]|nr:alpha-2-macroglobulin family protein [Anaerolineae bacterium]